MRTDWFRKLKKHWIPISNYLLYNDRYITKNIYDISNINKFLEDLSIEKTEIKKKDSKTDYTIFIENIEKENVKCLFKIYSRDLFIWKESFM